MTDAKEAYYVFRLTKCGEGDVIDLISDDDEETKPVIVNGKVKNENKQMDSAQATTSKLPQEPAPETCNNLFAFILIVLRTKIIVFFFMLHYSFPVSRR